MERTGAVVKPRTLGREVRGSRPPVAVRCGLDIRLIRQTVQTQNRPPSSPDAYLEILLKVNLNFQVRLTIILANGIFPDRIYREVRCCHLMAISILCYKFLLSLVNKSLLNISLPFSLF